MSSLHDDYRAARTKIFHAPLTLCDRDFDVLREFNPADEALAHAALRTAQLALLEQASAPLETKAMPPRRPGPTLNYKTLADAIVEVATAIKARDAKIADLTATVAELKKAVIDTKAAVQALESASHPEPRIDLSRQDIRN